MSLDHSSDEATDATPPTKTSSSLGANLAFWGGAVILAGALIYGGFIYPKSVKADAGTLFSIAKLHLGLAETIPVDKAGSGERQENIARALAVLDDIEESRPGLAITEEFRGFAHWLAGDYAAARRVYASALERAGDDKELCTKIRSNLASIELTDGSPDKAIAQLGAIPDAERNSAVWITSARAWQAKGDHQKRTASLESGLRDALEKGDDREIFAIAEGAASLGDGIATSAFERLAPANQRAGYRLAQLKIMDGDTDSATSILKTVGTKAPKDLKRWIQQDHAFWVGARKTVIDEVLTAEAGPTR